MKALHVFYRIFHYCMVWCLILALLFAGVGLFYFGSLVYSEEFTVVEASYYAYLIGLAVVALVLVAIVNFVNAHVFKMIYKLCARRVAEHEAEEECFCECCCKECEKEEKSDLDNQVDEVMKWKNLYVEGIITEREFIDKRNEILRISK